MPTTDTGLFSSWSQEVFTELRELRKLNEKQSDRSEKNYKELNDKIDKVENVLKDAIHNTQIEIAKDQTAHRTRTTTYSVAASFLIAIAGLIIGFITLRSRIG